MKPIVAIVGRPNVGKSTLFNKLVGQKLSIVEDTPGVTRDRIYAEAEWRNRKFILVDTGGIEPLSDDVILSQMRSQAQIAIESADVIIFMTDIRTGMTNDDMNVCRMLQKSKKPFILCVNKIDKVGSLPNEFYEFYSLGAGEPIPLSSVHGHGTGDLLDEIFKYFPKEDEQEYEQDAVKVALIGKPNVGKSSLLNKLSGEERSIVSDIAGTTRDAVDSYVENKSGKYIFIDTAGMRKRKKVDENIEKYSILRAISAIERSDVCLIMIDATEGVTEQDTKVAGFAHDNGKGCIIVVNKWDIVEKDTKTMSKMTEDIRIKLGYMTYAPVIFISAKTGQRIDKLYEIIQYVNEKNSMRISTGKLNDVLCEAVAKVQPPSDKGRRLKVLYMTQVSIKPPTFVIFVNDRELFHFSYQRYIENQIRDVFALDGTPIRIIVRERTKDKI